MRSTSGKRFPHRIVFQQATETKNAFHEIEKTWATVATVWARVEPLKGSEIFEAQKVNAQNSIKVTIRARNDLTNSMRLVYNSTNYEITYIPPYDARQDMTILANQIT